MFLIAVHVIGVAWCAFLFWLASWALAIWLALGVAALVLYIMTWTDTPAIWWWPYLIMCWPLMLMGGIVHPVY